MSGTTTGGQAARDKNLARDPDFYRKIGKLGGRGLTGNKGFARMTPEKRKAAGALGGTVSKRDGSEPDYTAVAEKRAALRKVMESKDTKQFTFRGKAWFGR